jgi:hypothetical protein
MTIHEAVKIQDLDTIPLEEQAETECIVMDAETWKMLQDQMRRDIMRACASKIWYNHRLYRPTEFELPYAMSMLPMAIKGDQNH